MQGLSSISNNLPGFENISIKHVPSTWSISSSLQELIDSCWIEHVVHCKRHNIHTFDGLWYRIENTDQVLGGSTSRKFSTIRHRYYVAATKYPDIFLNNQQTYINHLSTGCLPLTTDNYYVFGKRSKNDSLAIIGGGVQHDDLAVYSGNDLQKNLFKELYEELAITSNEVGSIDNLGFFYSRTSNIETLSIVYLTITRNELENYFEKRPDPELSSLLFISPNELGDFLHSRGQGRESLIKLLV